LRIVLAVYNKNFYYRWLYIFSIVMKMKLGQTKVLGNMTVTVPKVVREALNLKAGDYLEWHVVNQEVIVRRRLR
jgi:AbrB family looped-hinge helix DNA binding protein